MTGPAGPAGGDRRRRHRGRHVEAAAGTLGVTHWSAGCWRSWASRSPRSPGSGGSGSCSRGAETFKFSTDPELEAKVRDVVGLYLNPPDKAIVLCIDEKSQVQALDRTAPMLPLRPGMPEKRPTTTSGTAPPPCSPRWRSRPGRSPTPATPGTATRSSSLPQAGREGLPAGEAAHRRRQLRHPQTPGRDGLAGQTTRGSRCTSPRPPGRG